MLPEESNSDKPLNQVKFEYQQKKTSHQDSDETEELLEDVRLQFQQQSQKATSAKDNCDDDLFADIKSQFKQQSQEDNSDLSVEELKSQFQNQSSSPADNNLLEGFKSHYQQQPSPVDNSQTETLLSSLKNQHQTQKTQQEEADQKRKQEEILKAEQQKQKKRKHLTKKAQAWLENLDPYSEEGFWFEEFADSYSSRLEAAIDYLAVLEETS